MKILVQRNGQTYGPYTEQVAAQYLLQGQLMPQDLAKDDSLPTPSWLALEKLLASSSTPNSSSGYGVISKSIQDLKSFDMRLLFPWTEIKSFGWIKDRKLMYLAIIGLAPATALAILGAATVAYWAIALYFSALWALFFYYLFKTAEVKPILCFICFFFTGIISIAILLTVQQIPPWNLLYPLTNSQNFITRFFGMFFAVGISEEICKAAIVYLIVRRPGVLLSPQTVVFYGMISGLGFGIYEGVAYQQSVNREQGVDAAYFLNIARLTSLPFLHAIWTGIAAYFISFAALVPNKKNGLFILAIVTPAALHAIYNTFGWNIIGLGSGLFSVVLLMTYLSNCNRMYQHLGAP
jgi:RsiW-degrading membrane proteinase PrsW (M82 family)